MSQAPSLEDLKNEARQTQREVERLQQEVHDGLLLSLINQKRIYDLKQSVEAEEAQELPLMLEIRELEKKKKVAQEEHDATMAGLRSQENVLDEKILKIGAEEDRLRKEIRKQDAALADQRTNINILEKRIKDGEQAKAARTKN